jgi:hypothetical protein
MVGRLDCGRILATITLVACLGVGLGRPGCSPISTLAVPSGSTGGEGQEVTVKGDWNDVTASVYAAIRDQEVALLSEKRTADRVTYELLTARDEPVRLVATRTADQDSITLRSRFGHFGDPARERRFTERIASRLRDLAGVDYRPIR